MVAKPPSSTIGAAVEAMREAMRPLPEWPGHLYRRDCDTPYWTALMRSRALSEWTDHDLAIAAEWSRTMADIDGLRREIDGAGGIASGTSLNPRFLALRRLTAELPRLSRLLRLNAAAPRPGDDRATVDNHRRLERSARELVAEADHERALDDMLLAAPSPRPSSSTVFCPWRVSRRVRGLV